MAKSKTSFAEQPAASKDAAMARGLAASNAAKELVQRVYGPNATEILRSLPKPDLQKAVCELMMAGLSMIQCAEVAGLNTGTISRWFSTETVEMQKLMKTALTRDAMIEMPKTWATLKGTRDSENEETRRKGSLDCMRAGGLAIDPGAGSAGISIHAQNLQFNNLSVADLDRKLAEIGARLGPEALKLVDAEVRGNGDKHEEARAGASTESGVPAPAADAARGVPGTPSGKTAP